ncbi:MAG TPA: FkbM family methyltransferase [Gemmataceae bacterium]|jgi:FkbM family methyltransferase
MLKNVWTLVMHPRMAAKYAAWMGTRLTGRACTVRLPGGGTIGGFRRFSDYWMFGGPSPAEVSLLRRVVRPGGVVADVGANVGAFTVTMARLAPGARVLAFEPAPSTIRLLRANVERNRLTNVEVIRAAVADAPGQLAFTDDTAAPARNRFVTPTAGVGSAPVVRVDAVRLDQFCADRGITHLDFVKTDTEGAEARVVRGAAELLRHRRIGALLAEVCPAALAEMGSSVREFLDAVESFGYAAVRLRPDGTAGDRLGAADLERIVLDNVLVQPP